MQRLIVIFINNLKNNYQNMKIQFLLLTIISILFISCGNLSNILVRQAGQILVDEISKEIVDIIVKDGTTKQDIPSLEEYVNKNAPSEDAFVAVQKIAGLNVNAREWDKSMEVYKKFKPKFPGMESRFDKIISNLNAKEEGIKPNKLPDEVNKPNTQSYIPQPTADNKGLYFCSNNRPEGEGGEDVYYSEFSNGKWQNAKNISDVNSKGNDAPNSISVDGNELYVFRNGKNFVSAKQRNGSWSDLNSINEINSSSWQGDAILSPDGNAIFFSSDRSGGVGDYHAKDKEYFHGGRWGNTDIYVSEKQPDGKWGSPVNIGSVINTPYTERTPFIHPDGKTLYFSSDGHAGLGKMDVFKSTRLNNDSWTKWSEPVNLGKEINNASDDWGYKITTDGEKAYFAKFDADKKESDIYSIGLPKTAKPDPVATIHGKVTDQDGNKLYDASIRWENLITSKIVGELKSNPQDATYFAVLPLGNNYGFYANKEGYYPVTVNIDLLKQKNSIDINQDFKLVKITTNVPIRINNVFFDFDKYDLKSESNAELNRLATTLNTDYKNNNIEILGHTDNQGADAYNLTLSQKRAESVMKYLVSKGCNSSLLSAKGFGKTKPIASNDKEAGRSLNRRVEFMIK